MGEIMIGGGHRGDGQQSWHTQETKCEVPGVSTRIVMILIGFWHVFRHLSDIMHAQQQAIGAAYFETYYLLPLIASLTLHCREPDCHLPPPEPAPVSAPTPTPAPVSAPTPAPVPVPAPAPDCPPT